MPKWLQHDPVGCVYLPIRVSSDGRFARVGVGFLNWQHAPCSRYTFNGPDWILRKAQLRWRMIARTGAGAAKPACSLGIPSYLLLYGCRR